MNIQITDIFRFFFTFSALNIISVHTDVKNICLDKEKNISKYLSAI